MVKLIILLLIIGIMAALAIQNPTAFPLVVLGSYQTAAIPLGLMIVGAVVLGMLLTLILYGLVGLRRPPESKYRPMGSRVPYPASPGATDLPPSGPPYQPPATYSTPTPSTAFVSEPATSSQDSTPASPPPASGTSYSGSYSTPSSATSSTEPYTPPYQSAYAAPDTSVSNPVDPLPEPIAADTPVADSRSEPLEPLKPLEPLPSPEPRSTIVNPFAKKKRLEKKVVAIAKRR